VEIVKKELNDGKRFVSNDYFVEVNNNHLSREPLVSSSIIISKCDNGMSDINYNNHIEIKLAPLSATQYIKNSDIINASTINTHTQGTILFWH